MAVSPLLHHTHEVLNPDFCSGYIDAFGKWNTGFPCPWQDSAAPGFCCGTENYKYCCSGNLRLVTSSPANTHHTSEDPLLLVLAITLGVAAGITLLILVACFICPGCLLHKKRRPGPLYRLPCSSTMSTYVPATTSSHHHHHHHQAPGAVNAAGRTAAAEVNDVRSTSASFHSFSNSGVPSFYSLSEPLCPEDGDRRDDGINRACHHLYWSRALPATRISSSGPAINVLQQQHTANNHGHCFPSNDTTLPPPYEVQPHLHGRIATDTVCRPAPGVSGSRQHISPRQPALCIIDDVISNHRRDSTCSHHHLQQQPQQQQQQPVTYHSTKF